MYSSNYHFNKFLYYYVCATKLCGCYKIDKDVSVEEQSFKIPVDGQEHLSWVIQDDLIRNMIRIGQDVLTSRETGNFYISDSTFLVFDNSKKMNKKFTLKLNSSAKRKSTVVSESIVSNAEPTKTKRPVGKKNDGGKESVAIEKKDLKDLSNNVLQVNDVKRKAEDTLDRDNRLAKRNLHTLQQDPISMVVLVDGDETRGKGC